jgi:hypothetical protein
VGVVFAQHFANDTGAFAVGGVGADTHVVHGVEDAPVDGFEAVAGIGQGAGDDDAHGVIEVGVAHLLVDVYGVDWNGRGRENGRFPHHHLIRFALDGWGVLKS